MRRQREKAEQAQIVRLLRMLGAEVWVLGTRRPRGDYPGTRQTPGLCDLLSFLPSRAGGRSRRLVAIEVKAHGGRLRPAQVRFRQLCQDAGIDHLVGGLDDIIEWLSREGYLTAHRVPQSRPPVAGGGQP